MARKINISQMVKYIFAILIVTFLLIYVFRNWEEISNSLKKISLAAILISFLFLFLGMLSSALAWSTILNSLGERVPFWRSAQILFVGLLGKYIPGSVWSYVYQMELGKQYNVARPRILITSLYAAGIALIASTIIGTFVVNRVSEDIPNLYWLYLVIPVGLVLLHPRPMTFIANIVLKIFKRSPLETTIRWSSVIRSLFETLLSYVFFGIHIWVLVQALGDVSFVDTTVFAGAIALGFSLSLFVFLAPSGVGVREFVLILVVALFIGQSDAVAVSLVSRALFTFADIAIALVSIAFAKIILDRKFGQKVDVIEKV